VWSNTIIDYVEVNAERTAARARELKAASLKLSEEEKIEWDDDDASYDDEDEGERGGDGSDTGDASSAVLNEDSHEETSKLVNSGATKETARVNDRNNAAGVDTSASTTAQEHRDAAHRVKRVAADGVETGAQSDEEDDQADLVHALTRAGAVQRPALLESVTRLHTFFYVGENMSGTHLHAHGAACSVSTGRKLWFMYNPDDYHCGLADVPKVRCALDVPCWTQRTAPRRTALQCRASTPTMHIHCFVGQTRAMQHLQCACTAALLHRTLAAKRSLSLAVSNTLAHTVFPWLQEVPGRCDGAANTTSCLDMLHPLELVAWFKALDAVGRAPRVILQNPGDIFCFPERWYHATLVRSLQCSHLRQDVL